MLNEETRREFIEDVKHGESFWYREAGLLAKGLQYKRKIPQAFWNECDNYIFKCQVRSKPELIQLRADVISAVVQTITEAAEKDVTAINDLYRYVYCVCSHYPQYVEADAGDKFVELVKSVNMDGYLEVDHYARYFHILAILGIPKSSQLLPATTPRNYAYNLAYHLWKNDDGSETAAGYIVEILAWYSAEIRKAPWRDVISHRHN